MIDAVTLITNADLRLAANRNAWPTQQAVERAVTAAFDAEEVRVERGHAVDPKAGHGFIDRQRRGMEVFREIDPERPLVVVLSTWQYSHHILHGLLTHRAPILTVANWSGTWPGLVGLLNLNASLTKAGVPFSSLWSETFEDAFFRDGLRTWLRTGRIAHDTRHVRPAASLDLPEDAAAVGRRLGDALRRDKAILGVFDEGCMGMYNAIVPDALLHPTGLFKERLSQSALYYATTQVADAEAQACRDWLDAQGVTFHTGPDPATDLTDAQILRQLKMYIAALRLADDFGCAAIGIQYQQGLKDVLPASDLAEGLLNNTERPPAFSRDGSRELFPGVALPHFNEVDECAGIDALVTHRVWRALGLPPETTLHDVRWGAPFGDDYVWVFEISGAAPPAHFIDGYRGASSMRQPPMYFRLGGGTLRGISKPGEIVWSRVFIAEGRLRADVGRGHVVALPDDETQRRWEATTVEWPIMHTVLHGVTRDQMMARHASNHVQVAYAPDAASADRALVAKVAMFEAMGIEPFVCGTVRGLTA